MPKQITKTVYEYHELSDRAKDRARNWWIDLDFEWYGDVYEDAKSTADIKIEGFDIGRGQSCDIKFLTDAPTTLRRILSEHGDTTGTWKVAKEYEKDVLRVYEDESAEDEAQTVVANFKKALEAEFLTLLRDEHEYRTGDEYIAEVMQANEYTFDENGRRDG